jgi:hypothetical protein
MYALMYLGLQLSVLHAWLNASQLWQQSQFVCREGQHYEHRVSHRMIARVVMMLFTSLAFGLHLCRGAEGSGKHGRAATDCITGGCFQFSRSLLCTVLGRALHNMASLVNHNMPSLALYGKCTCEACCTGCFLLIKQVVVMCCG